MKFILIYQGDEGEFKLVGPFESANELSKWGRRWQKNNRDDPRWQEIHLKMDEPIIHARGYTLEMTTP